MWSQAVVRQLLEFGANIGVKNIYDEVPVAQILPETLERFLDDFCLQSEGNVTNDKFKITLKFDFLVPPYDQKVSELLESIGSHFGLKFFKNPDHLSNELLSTTMVA
jgi:hypothetical protein